MSAGSAALIASLNRLRLRLRFVAFVRFAVVIAGFTIVALEVGLLATRPTLATALAVGAAALAAALAGAGVVAVVRTPTIRETAIATDRRLRLEDRVVTAVQVRADPDAVADLVVRNAVARLAAVRPSNVFPVTPPRSARWLAAAVAVLPLLFLVASLVRAPRGWIDGGARHAGDDAPAGAPASRRAESADTQLPGDQPPATPAATVGSPARAGAGRTDARRGSAGIEAEARGAAGGPPEPAETATRADGPRMASVPGAARAREDAAGRREGSPGAAGPVRGAGGGGRGRGGEDTAGAAGGGRAALADRSAGAGGVAGEVAGRTAIPPAPPAPPGSAAYAPRYREAWARAQAALARDRVPSNLRTYVRDYFIAIRPRDYR